MDENFLLDNKTALQKIGRRVMNLREKISNLAIILYTEGKYYEGFVFWRYGVIKFRSSKFCSREWY